METVETDVSVWTEVIKEYAYYGKVLTNSKSWETADQENDNLRVNVRISILADPYARQHFHNIRYLNWMGTNWKVSSVEVKFPRLVLSLGDVYVGENAQDSAG